VKWCAWIATIILILLNIYLILQTLGIVKWS
jgi:manganese transport protein